ncbi:stabilizer of axonemal microtubules 2 [Lates calcarifer]|uniref:Stabilizer of axonemal microtubules 2 n=1 Tax=Lates calcarifer TaxID=8187 RepID=A0AAJ7Q3Z2_LATCA|nr:stabilizer of axonemal microtubules 2 [Lates calcarifer]
MHPKTMRQQNTQHNGSEQATPMRKQSSIQRAQTRASMTTEYQERFLPPHCHTTVVSTSTQKNPYHQLKGTSANMTTFRSYYVTHKCIKNPPKAPQPSLPPKNHRRCSSAPHDATRFVANQLASKVEDYTSVYKNDFRAWTTNKRQPYRLNDSLKVNQGLVVTNGTSKEDQSQKNSAQADANSKPVQKQEPQPFESITSYRSDYITHPVQPRIRREKPVKQTNKGLPLEPVASFGPKLAWHINQELFDGASDFFQQFKTWSLETKFHGQGKAKASSPADDNPFVSTTHTDYTPHKCQRTKPILPCVTGNEKSKEPFQTTTTMKEDYKAWDTPRRLPIIRKEEMEWPKKTPFSVSTSKPAESCKTNPKSFSLHPNTICNSSCNATENPQCPAENGTLSSFGCISNGAEESRMYWSTSVDREATWPDGDICNDPSQPHQIISCMVSSRS